MTPVFDPIPETVQEALTAWDSGESVFSVEMGGLGPGYEMAIQALAFEFMRELQDFRLWDCEKARRSAQANLDAITTRFNKEPWGGFSGAQVGAAQSLASCVCRQGYRAFLRKPELVDRLIQVCKKDLRQVR